MIQAVVVDKCEHCVGDEILLTLDGLLALSPSKMIQSLFFPCGNDLTDCCSGETDYSSRKRYLDFCIG